MRVFNLFAPVHPVDVLRNNVHRTRAEKRDHRDKVRKFGRLHLHDLAGHSAAFQLEHPDRVSLADVAVDLGVVCRNVFQGQLSTVPAVNQFAGFCHDSERDQPQKVHFEQTQIVDPVHIILGD